jgi:serine/threonine protein kinase/tetratricopeptide (TPR) repeat protein
MKCPKCDFENPADLSYCGKCGTQLDPAENLEVPPTKTIEAPKQELTTGSVFGDRYQIIEELGKGGMGRVYKALDTKINEKIALKLIKPEIASDKKTIERFSNELKFARKIRHKNVCQMFDLGEYQGTHFITMEYVAGGDLKRLIRKMGRLSAGQAISIAKQVCDGLGEAHKHGVVHRDLKPQNVMVDDEGSARIMDFGIARSIEGKSITGAGVMIGTPDYMSPEQVESKETDQRSDIYSLGVILYEMVTGQVPFEGDTPFSIGVKHKSEAPKPPKELNEQIPDELNRVILRCLEKDKNDRYQSTGELCSELVNIEKGIPTTDRIVPKVRPTTSREVTVTFQPKKVVVPILIIIALIAAAVIIWKVPPKKDEAPGFPDEPTIAVLPFSDLSPQKDQEVFCESISEYIITKLSKLDGVKVIQGDSAMHFKDSGKGPQSIGKELGVDAVLHGNVLSSGKNLTVVPKLMNVTDASIIWSDEFTKPAGDALNIQSTIALQIARHLQTELSSDDTEQIAKQPTENIEAYNRYQMGRHFWRKRGRQNVGKAVQYLEEAIEIDPSFALAYAGLADCYISLTYGRPLEEAIKIKKYASKALELNPKLVEAHTALALFKYEHEWDFKGAKQAFEQAIALNPGYATAHHWYGRYYWWTGEIDKAIAEMKIAQELDPLSPSIHRNLGLSYYYAHQYDKAFEHLNRSLEIDPEHRQVHLFKAWCYLGMNMYDEALEEFRKEFSPDSPVLEGWKMAVRGLHGETDTFREWIQNIEKQPNWENIVSPFFAALAWAILGEADKVFFYLDKAYENRSVLLSVLQLFPYLDDYRSDPRYEQLLEKLGLR